MIALALLTAVAADFRPLQIATLTCGAGAFRIESRRWAGREAPLAPATQSMTVGFAGTRHPVRLESTRIVAVDGRQVRNRYVISWSCLTSEHRKHYLLLAYACAVDSGYPNDCGGEQEWFRYLDDRGRAVDKGTPHNGRSRVALQQRLGLARTMREGSPMTSLVN